MEISFSVLSIEDTQADADAIRRHISFNPHFRYIGNAPTLELGMNLLTKFRPDLLILDIDLPDGNSIDRLKEIRDRCDWPLQIVFHTVYDNYVIQAIRQQAFDYLIKPFLPEEMSDMLRRVEEAFRKNLFAHYPGVDRSEVSSPSRILRGESSDDALSTTVMVSNGDGFRRIDLAQVVYFEHIPKSKYWRLFLPDGSNYTLRKESSNADILPMNPNFVQLSQSAIINLDYLGVLKKDTVTLLPPFENVQIVVSRNFLPGLQSRLLFI